MTDQFTTDTLKIIKEMVLEHKYGQIIQNTKACGNKTMPVGWVNLLITTVIFIMEILN